MKHSISQQDLINLNERQLRPKAQNLKDLAFELCTRANQHLNSARDLSGNVPANVKPLFADAIRCSIFLSKMEEFDFDLMNPNMNSEFKFNMIFKLLMAKIKNTY